METYKAKSVIVGRKKGGDEDFKPCFICLFNGNEPHKTGEVPFEILDYEKVHKVHIKGLDISYLLPGNDLVINDLESINVIVDGPHISLEGKQAQ
ncbi:MAG: hypothetical protein KJ955_05695 [Nanoarchaeota archaeon]|nr:hypothetical protein [Nanoarchaeota archaeon]